MANEFENFDLRSELDDEAFNILNKGNSDLVFGGSSEQEAQIFGRDISANDAPRVGAFLGGVALANLKVQNQRSERFARIRSLQDEILKREQQVLARDRLNETVRGNQVQEGLGAARLNENIRSNKVTETVSQGRLDEAVRSNQVQEGLSRGRLNETISNNKSQRGISQSRLDESIRSNQVQEGLGQGRLNESVRANQVQETLAQNKARVLEQNQEDTNLLIASGVQPIVVSEYSQEVKRAEANKLRVQQSNDRLSKAELFLESRGIPLTTKDSQGNDIALTPEDIINTATNILKKEKQEGQ